MPRKKVLQPIAVEPAFDDLCRELAGARGALAAVEAAAGDDPPAAAAARQLIALVEQAARSAERGRKAAHPPVNIDVIRRALLPCQRHVSCLMAAFRGGLGSPQKAEELRRGERHELAWRVGRSAAPVFAADRALADCWRQAGAYAALNPGGALPFFAPPP